MRAIQKIAFGQDVVLAQNAILRQPVLWEDDKIVLRGQGPEGIVNWFTFDMLPQLRPFIFGIMGRVEGEELREVWLERGQEIELAPAETSVFVMPIAQDYQAQVTVGDEIAPVVPGDVWWLSGIGAKFTSQREMIVLVVKLVQNSPATYAPEIPNA